MSAGNTPYHARSASRRAVGPSSQRFDLIVFEKFTYQGKPRYRPHKVGTAVPAKDGYTLYIPAGLSITGRVVMVPEKTEMTEIDLLALYESAADEHGL